MIQDTIHEAINQVLDGKLIKALRLLKPVFAQHSKLRDADEIEQIDDTLHAMLHYMSLNAPDPDRIKLYRSLLKRTYRVAADLEISWRCKNVGFYITQFQKAGHLNMSPDFIRTVLETFVSDVAMLSLNADETNTQAKKQDIYVRHQTFMERLFASITVSCQWSDSERKFWTDLLTSPTIDVSDAQLLVSAITISVINQFDANKAACLADVYTQASDTALRQRALIGFVFSVDDERMVSFYGLNETIKNIVSMPGTAHELLELQKQLFYCLNAERDTKKIEHEIMPDLANNAPYRVTGTGMIEEKEPDRMQEILHPDSEDKAMEKIEQSMQKITEMQRQGADIYFGGFSRMKRFPFFSTASNWFLPYSSEQPDVARVRQKTGNGKFIDLLMSKSAFCESDKYSFTFAVDAIFDRMPPNLKEMMNSAVAMGVEVPEEESATPTFVRRQYLQDLYRFFKIHPQRTDLKNPFTTEKQYFFFVSPVFDEPEINKQLPSLAVFLHDQDRYKELAATLHRFNKKQRDTLTYWLLRGTYFNNLNEHDMALESFSQALEKAPDNEMALRGVARSGMLSGEFAAAADAYEKLLQIEPGRKSFLVNRALALINQDELDEAAKVVYEADYRYPDDANISRVKAWLLMHQQKPEEALAEYRKLTANGSDGNIDDNGQNTQQAAAKPLAEDFLNMGYALWATQDLGGAAKAFRSYLDLTPDADIFKEFNNDSKLLSSYGFTRDDLTLMEELVIDM